MVGAFWGKVGDEWVKKTRKVGEDSPNLGGDLLNLGVTQYP